MLFGCVSERKNQLEGTWRLVSGSSKVADTTYDYTKMGYGGLKMYCDNHFMFVGRFVQSDTTENNYGGGNYTLEGNILTEVIRYFPVTAMIGDTLSYEIRFSGDTLTQQGPRKIGKYRDSKWELHEVYVRAK
jgi:hypothetical protein